MKFAGKFLVQKQLLIWVLKIWFQTGTLIKKYCDKYKTFVDY